MCRILFILLISFSAANCQDFGKLKIVSSLPNYLDEISGIEKVQQSDLLWMVNDSGGEATLYGYNISKEKVEKTISVSNGRNKDWEDLASDSLGNLYIGDFGNNNNLRTDLVIYCIKKVSEVSGGEIEVSMTRFNYEDQTKFPPKKKNRNFDTEAFIHLNNSFYLFTRNRQSDFDGITKVYKLPAKEGSFEAKLIGSYKTCEDRTDCQITSAAIEQESGRIALLSYNKVWLLSNYPEDRFFEGKIQKIKLEHLSQKESIVFDRGKLIIVDERSRKRGGNIYYLKL